MASRRFQIKIDPVWRPLMLVGAATKENSYVEVNDGSVEVRMGAFFHHTMPKDEILSAAVRDWPWYYGFGWRFVLPNTVGLVGSQEGVVELALSQREHAWRFFPYDKLAISLEEPEEFLDALQNGA